jgi:hypothetical protein
MQHHGHLVVGFRQMPMVLHLQLLASVVMDNAPLYCLSKSDFNNNKSVTSEM